MISLTFTVDNLTSVLQVFNTIQIRRYTGTGTPNTEVTDLVVLSEYTTVSGHDVVNDRDGVSNASLRSGFSQYYFTDYNGESEDWYTSRYYNTTTGTYSGWSAPVLGEPGDLYCDPVFPPEIEYGSADKLIIDRVRLLIGDPIGLRREYGEEALSSIHTDGKTYEMDETGWPAYINMGGKQYTDTDNPSVNGYKYLRFQEYIDDICKECVTYSGTCGEDVLKEVIHGIDIWYYTFRHSDRQIMEAYDNCPPPAPLTTITATPEAYMLQTSIDLLRKELWEDSVEDGADIKDEGSYYSPAPGLKVRRALLDDMTKRLDVLKKVAMLTGITGVLID